MKSIRPFVATMLALILTQGCSPTETLTPLSSTPESTVKAIQQDELPTAAPIISAQTNSHDQYIAVVNGQEISSADFEERFAAEQAVFQQQPDHDITTTAGQQALARFRSGLLDRMIDEVLIEQIAIAMNVSIDETELEQRATALAQETGQEFAAVSRQVQTDMLTQIVMDAVTADLDNIQPQNHAKQILAANVDQANMALEKLENGVSWNDVAAQYSSMASAANDGGDLGFLPVGVMPPAFDEALSTLSPGQYSEVVQSETGIHIILLVEHSDGLPVADAYWPAVKQQAFTRWLASYREASIIMLTE